MKNDTENLDFIEDDEIVEPTESEKDNKVVQTLTAQKAHYREKTVKLSTELEEAKRKLAEYEAKNGGTTVPATVETPKTDDIETVLSLRADGYSDSEVLTLRKYSTKMGLPISEVLQDPILKAGFEAKRQEAKVAQSTPNPSNGTFSVQGKAWDQMTKDERRANYNSAIQGKKGDNSNT
jgi:hypothetical protein